MIFESGRVFYHGSYVVVDKPDLLKCESGKDFGKGFYVTTDKNQAKRFVRSSIGKAIKNGIDVEDPAKGYVSKYEVTPDENLEVFEFETADREWLHCVAAHRMSQLFVDEIARWEKYDVISGKIANDTTNQVITAYINGIYGMPGSESADQIAISLLMPERLTDQICLRSKRALMALKYVGYDEQVIKGNENGSK